MRDRLGNKRFREVSGRSELGFGRGPLGATGPAKSDPARVCVVYNARATGRAPQVRGTVGSRAASNPAVGASSMPFSDQESCAREALSTRSHRLRTPPEHRIAADRHPRCARCSAPRLHRTPAAEFNVGHVYERTSPLSGIPSAEKPVLFRVTMILPREILPRQVETSAFRLRTSFGRMRLFSGSIFEDNEREEQCSRSSRRFRAQFAPAKPAPSLPRDPRDVGSVRPAASSRSAHSAPEARSSRKTLIARTPGRPPTNPREILLRVAALESHCARPRFSCVTI